MKEHKEGKGDLACLTLNLLNNSSGFNKHAGLFSTNIQINSGGYKEGFYAKIELMSSFRHNEQDRQDT